MPMRKIKNSAEIELTS